MNQASETNPLRSNAVLALLLWAGYVAFVMGLWWLFGIDYDVIGQPGNVMLPLVIPIGGGGLLLALAITRLGWWPPIMKETRPGHPRWMFWPLFVMFVFYAAQRLFGVQWSIEALVPLTSLIVGLACVGFSEELLHRGVLVHGLRSRLPEIAVWFVSSALFGLLHVPNAFFADGGFDSSLPQAGFAFLTGSALYAVRRLSGSLLICMLLHFLWDFAALSLAIAGGGFSMLLNAIGLFGLYGVAVIALSCVLWNDRSSKKSAN